MTTIDFVDQTIRDGMGSLWGQRVHSRMLDPIADLVDRTGYTVIDMPLTAVRFPVIARFFRVNPWAEADRILSAFPTTKRRIPLRPNSVQFGLAADSVVDLWIERICAHGMNSFWLQDVMYDIKKMARVVPVAKEQGAEVLASVMYGLSPYHTDEFFADKVRQMAAIPGVDGIYVEDTAGVLTPERASTLIPAILGAAGELSVELHVHNTTGLAPLTYVEGVRAGVRTLHTALSPLANGASLPSTEQTVANMARLGYGSKLDTKLFAPVTEHLRAVAEIEGYPTCWPNEYDLSIYTHQLPGGMMATLQRQLGELGAGERSPALLDEVALVRQELGYPIMATPISQLVGTQAVLNVVSGTRYGVVPDEIIRYVLGHYGEPAGPIDEEVRDKVLSSPRAAELATWVQEQPSREELRTQVGGGISDDELMLRLLVSSSDLERVGKAEVSTAGSSPPRPTSLLLGQLLDVASLRKVHLAAGGYRVTCLRS